MTDSQLEDRVKELEKENEALRLLLKQKNDRNAGRKPIITINAMDRMKALRAEGKSYAHIGRILGVSSTTIYNKLNS